MAQFLSTVSMKFPPGLKNAFWIVIATFIFSLFLPSSITVALRSFISYCFSSIFHYAFPLASIIIVFLIILLYFRHRFNKLFKTALKIINHHLLYYILIPLTIVLLVLLRLYTEIRGENNFYPNAIVSNVVILNIVAIAPEGHIYMDQNHEYLDEQFNFYLFDAKKNHSAYNLSSNSFSLSQTIFSNLSNPDFPLFFYYIFSVESILELFQMISPFYTHAVLHPCIHVADGKIQFKFAFDTESIIQPGAFQNDFVYLNELSNKSLLSIENLLKTTSYHIVTTFGCLTADVNRHLNNTQTARAQLDDSMISLENSYHLESSHSNDATRILIDQSYNDMSASINRAIAQLYLLEKNYFAAIQRLFNSIQANPYFPYNTYSIYKKNMDEVYQWEIFLKSSTLKIISEGNDTLAVALGLGLLPMFEDSLNALMNDIRYDAENYYRTRYSKKTEHSNPLTEDIIIRSLISMLDPNDAESQRIYDYIETELDNLVQKEPDNPFMWYLKAELSKYLPLGEYMHRDIYLDRIDQVKDDYLHAYNLDPDFTLLSIKVAMQISFQQQLLWQLKNENNLDKISEITCISFPTDSMQYELQFNSIMDQYHHEYESYYNIGIAFMDSLDLFQID